MVGEAIRVKTREQVGTDDLNNPVYDWMETRVENVLVAPGATNDAMESTRPDGVTVDYTLYFPKTFKGVLDHGMVCIRDEWLWVVGSPRPFANVNCPTQWNMTAEVTRVNG